MIAGDNAGTPPPLALGGWLLRPALLVAASALLDFGAGRADEFLATVRFFPPSLFLDTRIADSAGAAATLRTATNLTAADGTSSLSLARGVANLFAGLGTNAPTILLTANARFSLGT